MMHFGATLRLLRLDAGVSLRELARQIGVSSAYLSRVENGHDPVPTPDRLLAIARVLALPPTALLELAHQVSPFVAAYLQRVPAANALFLDVARRDLSAPQLARIKGFIDERFPLAADRSAMPRLTNLLAADRIVLGLECTDMSDVLDVAAARMAPAVQGPTARALSHMLLIREREAPTGIGAGFAVPHARVLGGKTTATFLTLASPLSVNTVDGEPLRAFVVVALGDDHPDRMLLLAQIARLLDTHGGELMAMNTASRALRIVRAFDAAASLVADQ